MTEKPCIICVAITGSLPKKSDNPAVPITVAEQVESAHEAFEAGARSCTPTSATTTAARPPTRAASRALLEGLRRHCPGMIVQLSTGGRSGAGRERGAMLGLKPDMASLAVGSNNFPTRVYENSPDLVDWLASEMLVNKVKPEIEAFDLSHVFQAVAMADAGKLKAPLYVQFVMGVKNAMPVDRPVFDFYVETLKRLAPDAEWCGAGIGRHQITLNEWCVSSGGHARTGLEDNVRLDRDTLAPVERRPRPPRGRALREARAPGRDPAQARAILGLPARQERRDARRRRSGLRLSGRERGRAASSRPPIVKKAATVIASMAAAAGAPWPYWPARIG